jgi:hypothetical protein
MALMNVDRLARQCEYPACTHRRRLWRAWLDPVRGHSLDGRWYCSPECFEQALSSTIRDFLNAKPQARAMTHRAPLGLLMLSRGFVDNEQLKQALKAQKDSGTGRVGEWLRHIGAATEEQVTQVLGLQWSIPVFPLGQSRRFLECAQLVPFPLLEVAEMVPVHHIPSSQHLYVAFIDRVNYSALYALEKMLKCHTEPCLAVESHIVRALNELRGRNRALEVVVDTLSQPAEMAGSILAHAIRLNATDVRVSGFDGLVWARVASTSGFTDVLFHAQRNLPELFAAAEPA